MQNIKHKPESDCGNYPETEFQYEMTNPPVQPHYKPPIWHEINFWINWLILIGVVGLVIYVWIKS